MHWFINNVFQKPNGVTYMQLFVTDDVPCPDCARRSPRRPHPPTVGPCPGTIRYPVAAVDVPLPRDPDEAEIQRLIEGELEKLADLKRREQLGEIAPPVSIPSLLVGRSG